jgi:hypothetical protein
MADRYEIAPHNDLWMRGARFGELVKVTKSRGWPDPKTAGREIAHLRMDATGRVAKFWLDELTPIAPRDHQTRAR